MNRRNLLKSIGAAVSLAATGKVDSATLPKKMEITPSAMPEMQSGQSMRSYQLNDNSLTFRDVVLLDEHGREFYRHRFPVNQLSIDDTLHLKLDLEII